MGGLITICCYWLGRFSNRSIIIKLRLGFYSFWYDRMYYMGLSFLDLLGLLCVNDQRNPFGVLFILNWWWLWIWKVCGSQAACVCDCMFYDDFVIMVVGYERDVFGIVTWTLLFFVSFIQIRRKIGSSWWKLSLWGLLFKTPFTHWLWSNSTCFGLHSYLVIRLCLCIILIEDANEFDLVFCIVTWSWYVFIYVHSYLLEDWFKFGYAGSLDVKGHHIWFRSVVHLNIHFWSKFALAALSVVLESFTNRCVEFVNWSSSLMYQFGGPQ